MRAELDLGTGYMHGASPKSIHPCSIGRSCNLRTCYHCQCRKGWEKAKPILYNLEHSDRNGCLYHVTLTITESSEMGPSIKLLLDAVRKLQRRAWWKGLIVGGCWSLHVAGGTGRWSPHLHLVVEAAPGVSICAHELSKEWQGASNMAGQIVHIAAINPSIEDLYRVVMYDTKSFTAIKDDAAAMTDYANEASGYKKHSRFGTWRGGPKSAWQKVPKDWRRDFRYRHRFIDDAAGWAEFDALVDAGVYVFVEDELWYEDAEDVAIAAADADLCGIEEAIGSMAMLVPSSTWVEQRAVFYDEREVETYSSNSAYTMSDYGDTAKWENSSCIEPKVLAPKASSPYFVRSDTPTKGLKLEPTDHVAAERGQCCVRAGSLPITHAGAVGRVKTIYHPFDYPPQHPEPAVVPRSIRSDQRINALAAQFTKVRIDFIPRSVTIAGGFVTGQPGLPRSGGMVSIRGSSFATSWRLAGVTVAPAGCCCRR